MITTDYHGNTTFACGNGNAVSMWYGNEWAQQCGMVMISMVLPLQRTMVIYHGKKYGTR